MSKEAMKLALARLQARTDTADLDAIAALNEALAEQPAQPPKTNSRRRTMDIVESINRYLAGSPVNKGERTRLTRARDEIIRLRKSPQPAQQEPVGTYHGSNDFGHEVVDLDKAIPIGAKLYTSPPASKPWVGLTDAERETLRSEADEADAGYRELIKATEAKLRKKNS